MPTLSAALHVYLQIDRAMDTNRNYSSLLNRMVTEIGPGRNLERIAYEDLVDYTATLRASVSQSTFLQYVRVIKTFFNWCVTQRYLDYSPAAGIVARKPPKDPDLVKAIPQDVLEKMFDLAKYNPRNLALLSFVTDTSCRIGGAASLVISRLDLEQHNAVVLEKGGKYERVYFGSRTAEALKAWLAIRPAVDHDYVFTRPGDGAPLKKSSMKRVFYSLSEKVAGKKYGAHSIRHAVGDSYAQLGLPPIITQHKMGHANLRTTLDHYYPNHVDNLQEISEEYDLAPLRRRKKKAPKKPGDDAKILRFEDFA